jgi:alpha-beta hydrolase superfamily lysophospholipase
MERVSFQTTDHIDIAGLWWDAGSNHSCLLLHAMPDKKEAWQPLADQLFAEGVNVLAIDLRGHGESGGGDFQKFTDEQHQKSGLDVESAVGFLKRYHPATQLSMCGASIGANLALAYMAEHKESARAVLLSAGLNYHGILAAAAVPKLSENNRVLFVASKDDFRGGPVDCGHMAEELARATSCPASLTVFDTGGHGVELMQNHPELATEIVSF